MNALARAAPVVAMALLVASACSPDAPTPDNPPPEGDTGAAEHFLEAYVTDDGRVLRHDQGDDVVSEGQAYGMLIAELAGRMDIAATIWEWTAEHLRRPDGMLSTHADQAGTILDHDSATDADVLAAFALLRYDGSDAEALHQDGQSLAAAVLEHAVAWDPNGRPVAVAGSWAVQPTVVVNPSYLMPDVFVELAARTGDDRWRQLGSSSVVGIAEATQQGRALPTDWARVDGGKLVPTPAPDGSTARYGLDAQRVPLWFAASCMSDARALAARWSSLLGGDRSAAMALTPDGGALDATTHAVPLLAAAASARASGQDEQAEALTRRATSQAASAPTYYGDAWVVLAAALAKGELFSC